MSDIESHHGRCSKGAPESKLVKKKYIGEDLKGNWSKSYTGRDARKNYKINWRLNEQLEQTCKKAASDINTIKRLLHCRNSYERRFVHHHATQCNLIHYTIQTSNIEYTSYMNVEYPMHGIYEYTQISTPRYIKAIVLIHPIAIWNLPHMFFKTSKLINMVMMYLKSNEDRL